MDDGTLVLARHKLDVDKYYRMAEVGILREEDRVELIDGEVMDMAPIGADHMDAVNGLVESLVLACAGRAIVSVQNPVLLDRFNVPQPDLAVFRYRADRYRTGGRPTPADVLLLAEVSDSSLRFDRTVKLPLYARAGVGECWIVDLRGRILQAHRHPAGGAYTSVETLGPGDRVMLSMAPEISLALDLVFG